MESLTPGRRLAFSFQDIHLLLFYPFSSFCPPVPAAPRASPTSSGVPPLPGVDGRTAASRQQPRSWPPPNGHSAVDTFVRNGKRVLALFKVKMLHHYDHRFVTYGRACQAQLNKDTLPPLLLDTEHDAPDSAARPCCWAATEEVDNALGKYWERGWFLGWRDVARSVDERIATVIPLTAVGYTAHPQLPAGAGTGPARPGRPGVSTCRRTPGAAPWPQPASCSTCTRCSRTGSSPCCARCWKAGAGRWTASGCCGSTRPAGTGCARCHLVGRAALPGRGRREVQGPDVRGHRAAPGRLTADAGQAGDYRP